MSDSLKLDVKLERGKNKYPLRGYFFAVVTAFFTAISYVFGKSVNKGLNPETVTFFWFFGAFFFSMLTAMTIPSQRNEMRHPRKYLTIFILSSVITAVGSALWIFSLRAIGLPLTSFLMKTQTLFSLFLGIVFLGERLNKWETVGIAITVAGGVIVAYQKEGYLIIGTLVALVAAFFYSLLSFIVKRFAQDLNMFTVANMRSLGVGIIIFIYLIAAGRFQMPGLRDLIIMVFGGVTGAYIAKASQFESIKILDVSHSTAVISLESLFVVLFSYFFFHDLPSVIKLIGGVGTLIGVVFLVMFRGERADVLEE